MFSRGFETCSTASAARRPGADTMMSTIGTEIWGSSSLGIDRSAISPTASADSRKSGVSGDRIVARVIPPERSGFMGVVPASRYGLLP